MRKRKAKKRPLLPDPKFNDQLVTRFVNMLMWDGKKSIALKVTIQSDYKTLNENDLTSISKKIVNTVEEKTGAKLRS